MNFVKAVLSTQSETFTLSAKTRYFTQVEVDNGSMQRYIETKADAKHKCHVFDYSQTLENKSHLSKTQ